MCFFSCRDRWSARQGCVTVAAADGFAIVKGIVDAAGEHGEVDPPALERRVGRAVFGYVSAS
jgi:hypothetical protein